MSFARRQQRNSGFTLVEVVIVMAIASLLIAGILVAFSGAQKARRDGQRKQDISDFYSYVEQWAGGHGNRYPQSQADINAIEAAYFSGRGDPTAGTYDVQYKGNWGPHSDVPDTPGTGQINYEIEHKCNDGSDPSDAGNPITGALDEGGALDYNTIVIWGRLESGGVFCINN